MRWSDSSDHVSCQPIRYETETHAIFNKKSGGNHASKIIIAVDFHAAHAQTQLHGKNRTNLFLWSKQGP